MSSNPTPPASVLAPQANQSNQSSSEWIDVASLEFILTCWYTLTHLFSDEQYEHFSQLGPEFKVTLFSRPLGMGEHPICDWFMMILAAFWHWWPIEDDSLLFKLEFEEKMLRSKEIMSLFVMALEERWSNPDLHPEGETGSIECMFALMWYLHNLIDELFPLLKEVPPMASDMQNAPRLVEVHLM